MTGPIAVAAPSPWDSTPSVWRVPLSRDDLELLQALVALHARGQHSDVVRIGGRDQAACFSLDERDERGQTRRLAEGAALVRRALEDRAE